MQSLYGAYVTIGALIIVSAVAFVWDGPTHFFEYIVGGHIFTGAFTLACLMALATVLAPLTTLPLVPMAAPVLGPFTTAVAAIVGWTLGAVVAFLIARRAGRPLLERYVSLAALERYEQYLPSHTRFVSIVLLRMILPVDILSYVLGVLSTVSFREYVWATALGVMPFAFIFSYLGDFSSEKDMYSFLMVSGVAGVLLGLVWWYVIQQGQHDR